MASDRMLGALILVGALAVLGVYAWLFIAGLSWWAFFIVSTVAVVGVMGIVAWIGYTMMVTPPPAPLSDLPEEQPTSTEKSTAEKKT